MRVLTGETASNFPSRREPSDAHPRDGEEALLSFFQPKTLEKNEGIGVGVFFFCGEVTYENVPVDHVMN